MMTARKRRWLAGALGAGLVALLLVIASLDNLYNRDERPRLTQRTVELYEPPPTAPPPARPSNSRGGGSAGMTLALDKARAPIALRTMQLDVRLPVADVGSLSFGGLGEGVGIGSGDGTGDGSGSGFGLVTLSELDQEPTVVSAPVFIFPDEAVERGIAEFDLQFHILIDEEGRVYPIAVVWNPFPALSAEFMDYASEVRFTPPTRLGIPVRTEYMWPIRIKR
jgi:hypothetical protein